MISEARFIAHDITKKATEHELVAYMDISKPCILILGGENTNTYDSAASYFRSIRDTLTGNNISDGLNLYSVYYDFGANAFKRISEYDRFLLFYNFRDPKQLAQMGVISQSAMAAQYSRYDTEPQYISDIYNTAIRPRLYAKNGEILPAEQIAKNLRNMVIWAHCHGSYVTRMLEQKVLADKKLAAQLSKTPKLLQNLIVINHAPYTPLENYQFTSLSFVSASDDQASLFTELDYNLTTRLKKAPDTKFAPAFLGPDFGNIVVTDRLKHDITDEHSHIGLRGYPFTDVKLTPNGKTAFSIERNALIKVVNAMIKGKTAPTIHQMVSIPSINYEQLKRRGAKLQRQFRTK